ncbi:type II toxin-antitoxin system RelE/ParE family toxin [Mucilaginibacter sp. BJC16-A38]|uniref:type II toxin-antitoxin system RelE/ParE family toxin n=1 Tax=Mucilaginibacter phenanthrenivorans TaxID=1234842 RepID=UPI0021584526|nr:type II toxin-antitoxin system RelE/ParE family toxin [Mucilaginibacter phenanthrenivorans]MCR8559246.1 type II toxin-antitoxin system RelE/ParE family toxin [Mucilaginibacter phenanthrenivorans]
MSYTVDLSFRARRELVESRNWYEEKQPGLGRRFVHEVFAKVHLIENNPEHYPRKKGFHEAKIDVFPFLIVYKSFKSSNMIIIISIFHMSRHPKKKY